MVSLTRGLGVPGPKEWSEAGCNLEVCRPPPSSAQPSPALPCPALPVRRLLQTDWLYSWTRREGGGRTRPPGTRSHEGGGLSMLQSRHTTPALGPGRLGEGSWHNLAPGFGLREKKGAWGRCGNALEGFGGGAGRPFREPLSGGGGEPSLSCSFKNI